MDDSLSVKHDYIQHFYLSFFKFGIAEKYEVIEKGKKVTYKNRRRIMPCILYDTKKNLGVNAKVLLAFMFILAV